MESKKHETGKSKTIKDKMKLLCTEMLGITELRWTGVGSDHTIITRVKNNGMVLLLYLGKP